MDTNRKSFDVQEELKRSLGRSSREGIAEFTRKLREAEARASNSSPMTEEQDHAARLVAYGNLTREEICAVVGCSTSELAAWSQTEAFQNKMAQYVKSCLINSVPLAHKMIRDVLMKGKDSDKINAAKLLLGVANIEGLTDSGGDLEADLNAIEARGTVFDEAHYD